MIEYHFRPWLLITSHFWSTLCHWLGVRWNLSTAYHPQTDGQTERQMQTLERYLRVYCNFQQDDWARWLPLAQFCYNRKHTHPARLPRQPYSVHAVFTATFQSQPYLPTPRPIRIRGRCWPISRQPVPRPQLRITSTNCCVTAVTLTFGHFYSFPTLGVCAFVAMVLVSLFLFILGVSSSGWRTQVGVLIL